MQDAAEQRVQIVMGVHGNGLTHILLMPEGGKIIEVGMVRVVGHLELSPWMSSFSPN